MQALQFGSHKMARYDHLVVRLELDPGALQWPNSPWNPFSFCGPQLSLSRAPTIFDPSLKTPSAGSSPPSKVAGFLGFGRIAKATVRRLAAFGISHILYADSSSPILSASAEPVAPEVLTTEPTRVSIATLAAHSDFLFVLAPQTPATYHIVSTQFLRLMKPSAILVNAARGGLVDSDALANALREGQIFSAGLDVVEGEPNITQDHPLIKEPRQAHQPRLGFTC